MLRLVLFLTLSAFALLLHGAQNNNDSKIFDLNIEEQSLKSALYQLAQQADFSLIADANIIPNIDSEALKGMFTINQALNQLLQNTNIHAKIESSTVILLPKHPFERKHNVKLTQDKGPSSNPTSHIIVRGYRDSLLASQSQKRNSIVQKDTIFSEDIADFPERNLGDAIQRLPGIVAERDNGETRQLGLRGLGPNFVKVKVNGIASLATFNSVFDHRGSATRSRNFDFNIFSADLFSKIDVSKTYSALEDEGGVAGTINLSTPRPFDYDSEHEVFNLQTTFNSISRELLPKVSFLATTRTERFGALFSAAYSESNNIETGFRDWGWRESYIDGAGVVIAPSVSSLTHVARNQRKFGATSSLQWRNNSNGEINLNAIFSSLNSDDTEFNLVHQNETDLIDFNIDNYNTLDYAEYRSSNVRSESKLSNANVKFLSATLDASDTLFDNMRVTALLGLSQSTFESPLHDKVFLQASNIGYRVDYRSSATLPHIEHDVPLTNSSVWALHRVDVREDLQTNHSQEFKLSFDWLLNEKNDITFGYQGRRFSSDGYERRDDIRNLNTRNLAFNSSIHSHPNSTDFLVANVDETFTHVQDNSFHGRLSNQIFSRQLTAQTNRLGTAFSVDERTHASFFAHSYNGPLFRSEAGVRFVHLKSVQASLEDQAKTQAVDNTFTIFLPTINLAWDISDTVTLRTSFSRNLSLPTIDDLRITTNVSVPDNRIIKGNPSLRPFVADTVDMASEFYFSNNNFLGIALFYKSMDSYITEQTQLLPFDQLGLPAHLLTEDREGELFALSQPVNGEGGVIKGAEVSLKYEFLHQTGILTNYTYSHGETSYLVDNETIRAPLFNLSKHTANVTLYTEQAYLGGRIAFQYRDGYLTQTDNVNQFNGIDQQLIIDAGFYVNVTASCKISFDILNLTNSPIDLFSSPTAKRQLVYTESGTTYLLGVHFTI